LTLSLTYIKGKNVSSIISYLFTGQAVLPLKKVDS